jgi:hypothetical protein
VAAGRNIHDGKTGHTGGKVLGAALQMRAAGVEKAAVVPLARERTAGGVSAAAVVDDWIGGMVYLAIGILQLLPHHGAVLQVVAGIDA